MARQFQVSYKVAAAIIMNWQQIQFLTEMGVLITTRYWVPDNLTQEYHCKQSLLSLKHCTTYDAENKARKQLTPSLLLYPWIGEYKNYKGPEIYIKSFSTRTTEANKQISCHKSENLQLTSEMRMQPLIQYIYIETWSAENSRSPLLLAHSIISRTASWLKLAVQDPLTRAGARYVFLRWSQIASRSAR